MHGVARPSPGRAGLCRLRSRTQPPRVATRRVTRGPHGDDAVPFIGGNADVRTQRVANSLLRHPCGLNAGTQRTPNNELLLTIILRQAIVRRIATALLDYPGHRNGRRIAMVWEKSSGDRQSYPIPDYADRRGIGDPSQ